MTRLTSILLVATALGAAASTSGCALTQSCAAVAYENGLFLDVRVPAAPAVYRVEVDADGDRVELRDEVTATMSRCLGACRVRTATHGVTLYPEVPDRQGFTVNVLRLREPRGPRAVHVRILRDDVEVLARDLAPQYEEHEPNGEGCGVQSLAHVALEIP